MTPPTRPARPTGEQRPTFLGALTWQAVPERPTVLVPVGSTEQHGPHLPVDTDSVVAAAVAAAATEDLCGTTDVVVAPTIAVGSSGEHQAFPGTLSIGSAALRLVVVELVRSAATWAGPVVFVNAHGGNVGALAAAVSQMRSEGHQVAWAPCTTADSDAHAGRTETSLMLHLDPANVRTQAIRPGVTTPIGHLLPRLVAGGVRSVSPTGVLGDPTGSTAAEGRQILVSMVAGVVERIRFGRVDARGCLTLPDREP